VEYLFKKFNLLFYISLSGINSNLTLRKYNQPLIYKHNISILYSKAMSRASSLTITHFVAAQNVAFRVQKFALSFTFQAFQAEEAYMNVRISEMVRVSSKSRFSQKNSILNCCFHTYVLNLINCCSSKKRFIYIHRR
jgi:hypothetical protein